MLTLDAPNNTIFDDASHRAFDPARRRWIGAEQHAPNGSPISWREAATWLQRCSGYPIRAPVAVVGPREANAEQLAAAESVGGALAEIGLVVLCGGRQGIMEAVSRGVLAKGGISIGLLPGSDPVEANPYVTVAIASGIGEARNAIIARAGFCLLAIGNSYGTLSEVALGLQFGRRVIGLCDAARIDGILHCEDPDSAIDAVCRFLLAWD